MTGSVPGILAAIPPAGSSPAALDVIAAAANTDHADARRQRAALVGAGLAEIRGAGPVRTVNGDKRAGRI